MLLNKVKNYFQIIRRNQKCNEELLWAKTWDDTKNGIKWMENLPSISPGRWAAGYNYIYVMTRILNETEPECVLDLGLGISSTLISQYFSHRDNSSGGIHDIIEQNPQWAAFYTEKHSLSGASTVYPVACVEKTHRGRVYSAYADIGSIVNGKKYDVISVDGPTGSDYYSRRDILEYLPDILSDSFAIVLDDTERAGEKSTVRDIMTILEQKGIAYCTGDYSGSKDCTVITSADWNFLCSL